jgi:cell division protein FtsB
MKLAIAAVLAAVLLVGLGTASAATPLEKRVASMQKQLTALKKQNTKLQKSVTKLQKNLKDTDTGVSTAIIFAGCVAAVAADAFQNTWTTVNQATEKTAFGPPALVADPGLCTTLQILRQPTVVPPTIAPFNALLALFTGKLLPSFGP